MISYELAKELKDAGFPHSHSENCYFSISSEADICDSVSLEEVIEACGDKFFQLMKDANEWFAVSRCKNLSELADPTTVRGCGSTPLEACARLWLAINKK